MLYILGVGPVALGGAIAASALSSIAAVDGIMGATGGAIAKMLTDHDVDGVSARQFEQQIIEGEVLLAVDTRRLPHLIMDVWPILIASGGKAMSARLEAPCA